MMEVKITVENLQSSDCFKLVSSSALMMEATYFIETSNDSTA
jgi:hypothetical protein